MNKRTVEEKEGIKAILEKDKTIRKGLAVLNKSFNVIEKELDRIVTMNDKYKLYDDSSIHDMTTVIQCGINLLAGKVIR